MEQNLKNRLTGAIVLVSLAVIFIPVILEGPDNEWTPLSHGIPEAPQLDYKARMELPRDIKRPAPVNRTPKVVEKPVYGLAKPARKQAVIPVPEPQPELQPEPEPEPEPVAREIPAVKYLPGWYVQVGSFSSEANASGLSKRLESSGYDASYQKISTKSGHIYRVMVGPDTSREVAEQLRDTLGDEFRLKGIIINNPR